MAVSDMKHFIALRKELTELRVSRGNTTIPLDEAQRDFVLLAQAEALCDLAATFNASISVDVND